MKENRMVWKVLKPYTDHLPGLTWVWNSAFIFVLPSVKRVIVEIGSEMPTLRIYSTSHFVGSQIVNFFLHLFIPRQK